MKDPLSPSKNHLLDLINALYAQRDHALISRELLTSLQVFVPFDAAALLPIDPRRLELTQGVYAGSDAQLIEDYLGRHAVMDPCLVDARCPTRLNTANSLSELLAQPAWSGSSLAEARAGFNFAHAVSIVAGWRAHPLALLRLHRRAGAPDFSAPELELLNGIAPHIAMSLVLSKSTESQLTRPEVGLLALTPDDQLVYSNDAAQCIVSQVEPQKIRALALSKSVWRDRDSVVYRLQPLPLSNRSLLSWLEHECAGDADERKHTRAGRVSVVVVERIQRRHALANRLVHSRLSRREVEVALCVMRGLSNAEIASELSIDEKTVKDHLRRIYGKIDVRSRTAMISKVLGLQAEIIPTATRAAKASS